MSDYKTPGVFIKEISKFPPSVAAVETAIPAFIGHAQRTSFEGTDYKDRPTRIQSLNEFETIFGGPFINEFKAGANPQIVVTNNGTATEPDFSFSSPPMKPDLKFFMYYCLQHYFDNGGGPCYIVAVGDYESNPDKTSLNRGLEKIKKVDEPTILLIADAPAISNETEFYDLFKAAISQSADLKDRVAIVDIFKGFQDGTAPGSSLFSDFRTGIGNNFLNYAVTYYPWLVTIYNYAYDETKLEILIGTDTFILKNDADENTSIFHQYNSLYHDINSEIAKLELRLPPSSALAGVYAKVDSTRGVWKAPANVSLNAIKKLPVKLTDKEQENLNVHPTGKSINAIREFKGKGILVWGARTLDGNSNEWRYISVRRFFNFVEESVKKASERFVFEPNDANTWTKVRSMIENFLLIQWRAGALAGAKPEDAFFVRAGLPETMTSLDILEGRMNVEIGMAVVRPAEFIILKFSHKMQVS